MATYLELSIIELFVCLPSFDSTLKETSTRHEYLSILGGPQPALRKFPAWQGRLEKPSK